MKKLGIIVARFQVPYLHAGHVHLINEAWQNSDRILVILGSPSVPNERNILSYKTRVEMIQDYYPFAEFHEIRDHHEDAHWSETLDNIIEQFLERPINNFHLPTLYGSRDCFNKFYTGKIPFQEIQELKNFSGTQMRDYLPPVNNANYRLGVIHGFNRNKGQFSREQLKDILKKELYAQSGQHLIISKFDEWFDKNY